MTPYKVIDFWKNQTLSVIIIIININAKIILISPITVPPYIL